jgi:Leucine-rich repeat (LRR) protein
LAGLSDMRVLKANVCDIQRLLGIEHCTNLEELYLEQNDISDIGPLAGLTNLRKLYLKGNELRNIQPISGLLNLTHLDLVLHP